MNVGPIRRYAIRAAVEAAERDRKPRWLFHANGVFWLERSPLSWMHDRLTHDQGAYIVAYPTRDVVEVRRLSKTEWE